MSIREPVEFEEYFVGIRIQCNEEIRDDWTRVLGDLPKGRGGRGAGVKITGVI